MTISNLQFVQVTCCGTTHEQRIKELEEEVERLRDQLNSSS